MRGAWLFAIAGCAASAPQAPIAPPPREPPLPPEVPIAAPRLAPPPPITTRSVQPDEPAVRWEPRPPAATAVRDVAESDFLSPCVRDAVLAAPVEARRALTAMLTQYATRCEGARGVIIDRPLGGGAARAARSDVAFAGELGPRGLIVQLRVTWCGPQSTADRIAIAADEVLWTSPRLELRREPTGCEVAELPYTRELGAVLARAVGADDARVVRGATELVLGDTIKHELRLALDALAAGP